MKKYTTDKKSLIIATGTVAVVAGFLASFIFKGGLDIGGQRQFFWNSDIIDTQKTTATLTMHRPVRQDIALTFNSRWEGKVADSFNIVEGDNGYVLYYSTYDSADGVKICCAVSADGIVWEKPSLGLVEFDGNTHNNIMFSEAEGLAGGFFVFKDTNPSVSPDEIYKAIGIKADGSMIGYKSADGINWNAEADFKGVTTEVVENINLSSVFWNSNEEKYFCYYTALKNGREITMLTTSKNFSSWSKAKEVAYNNFGKDFGVSSANVTPYHRSEDMLIGLPLRSVSLNKDMAGNFLTDKLTDTVFAYSTDGKTFEASQEALITAGPQTGENWIYGDSFVAGGIIRTPSIHSRQGEDDELSLYVAENMLADGDTNLARYTTRLDGFYSYNAPYNTQKVVTKPLVFDGSRMTLNFRTSTGGYVYVRILDKNGKPFENITYIKENGEEYTIPAYTSYQMVGDRVDREVVFNSDLSELSGKKVVIEFYLSDADIYSFKFDNQEYQTNSLWEPAEIEIRDIEMRDFDKVSYTSDTEVIDIGSDRQLFVDDYIVDLENTNATLTTHSPERKEEIFKTDLPWEGNNCDFYVILDDTDSDGQPYFRMYYLGWDSKNFTDIRVCYAYSYDGSRWIKPNLGLHSYTDSETGQTYTQTNIVLYTEEEIFDNFFVMKDTREGVPASQRYKAICQGRFDQLGYPSFGLWAWQSADGLHWKKTHRVLPQMEEWFGAFDSVNSLLWDEETQQFFTYFRVRESQIIDDVDYIDFRKIYGAVAPDFVPFDTDTLFTLNYGENSPLFEMYTNNISKYDRAPQMFIGFPTRFSRHSEWEKNYEYLSSPQARLENYNAGQRTRTLSMTDTMFMTSRDGYLWNRQNEAFFTPGPEYEANWIYGNCYPAYGLIETAADHPQADREISTYLFEGKFYNAPSTLYRYVLRLDGFASYKATLRSQKVTTKTFTFTGDELFVNFKTSAAGSVKVNMLDENGKAIEGYTALLKGDNTDRKVVFEKDLAQLTGKNVKLEFVLSDGEIYSFKFE